MFAHLSLCRLYTHTQFTDSNNNNNNKNNNSNNGKYRCCRRWQIGITENRMSAKGSRSVNSSSNKRQAADAAWGCQHHFVDGHCINSRHVLIVGDVGQKQSPLSPYSRPAIATRHCIYTKHNTMQRGPVPWPIPSSTMLHVAARVQSTPPRTDSTVE